MITGQFWSSGVLADSFYGRVVGVSDGDTITVLNSQLQAIRVRLAGIDAPEFGQPFSRRSKAFLSSLVFQQDVEVRSDKLDRYGRVVGKVVRADLDVGLQMIAAGFAWHYKDYEFEQSVEDRGAYAEKENDARRLGIGLWFDKDPMPPWEYRAWKRTNPARSGMHQGDQVMKAEAPARDNRHG